MDFIKLHNINLEPLLYELNNIKIRTFIEGVDESALKANDYLIPFNEKQYMQVPPTIYTMQLGVLLGFFESEGALNPAHYIAYRGDSVISDIEQLTTNATVAKLKTLTNNFDSSHFMQILVTYVNFLKHVEELQRIYFNRILVLNKESLLMHLDALTSLHAHYDSVLDGTSTKVIDEGNTKLVIELINLCESLYPIIIKEHENVKAVYNAIINHLSILKPYTPLLEFCVKFIEKLVVPIVNLMFNNLDNVTLHSKYIESIRVEIKYLKEIMSKAVPSIEFKNI